MTKSVKRRSWAQSLIFVATIAGTILTGDVVWGEEVSSEPQSTDQPTAVPRGTFQVRALKDPMPREEADLPIEQSVDDPTAPTDQGVTADTEWPPAHPEHTILVLTQALDTHIVPGNRQLFDETTDPDAAPSYQLIGPNRSEWPLITAGPTDGATHHQPVYFSDPASGHSESQIDYDASVAAQLSAAMEGSNSLNWHESNSAAILAQPIKFGLDLIWVPVKQPFEPVYKDDESPRRD